MKRLFAIFILTMFSFSLSKASIDLALSLDPCILKITNLLNERNFQLFLNKGPLDQNRVPKLLSSADLFDSFMSVRYLPLKAREEALLSVTASLALKVSLGDSELKQKML